MTYTPIPLRTPFGASRLVKRVHRIQDAQSGDAFGKTRIFAHWLCGSHSIDAIFIDDPAVFGDICQRCETPRKPVPPVVYRCYATGGQLLYIGSTSDWRERFAWHEQGSSWWPEVARVDRIPYPDLGEARRMEAAAIKAEAPLHNKVHNATRFQIVGRRYVPVAGAA